MVKFKRCSLCCRGARMRTLATLRVGTGWRYKDDRKIRGNSTEGQIPGPLPKDDFSFFFFFLSDSGQAKGNQGFNKNFENFKEKQTIVLITPSFLDSIAVFSVTARSSDPVASLPELAVYINVLMNWEKYFRVSTHAASYDSTQFSFSQCSPSYAFLVPITSPPKTKLQCRKQLLFLMENSLEIAKWLSCPQKPISFLLEVRHIHPCCCCC